MKNSFFLVIPPQQHDPVRLRQFEAKMLEHWLMELPTANPGLATKLMVDNVTEFNSTTMPMQTRLDALELMRPKFLIIIDYLRSRLINTAFPKDENELKILQVLSTLEREFTIGYWIVLKELTYRQVSWFQGKNLALSLQRCIKGLSGIIISHAIMGLPAPDWVWIDLHSLYKLSIKLKKDTVKVADSTNTANKSSSPEECYRQIVLLFLSRPSGLMQKEILLLYSFIENLFPFYSLSPVPIEGQIMQFVILTDEDKSPYTQMELDVRGDSSKLFLDTIRLIKAIENKDKYANPGQTRFMSMHVLKHEERPTAELLEYLEQRWLGIDLQKEALFPDRLDRYLSLGMAPAHGFQLAATSRTQTVDPKEEILVNSESDRLLSCNFGKNGIVSVGNLVSYRKADQPYHKRSLGIINELIFSKQKSKIGFGLTQLCTHYVAVFYKAANGGEGEPLSKGLFYNTEKQYEDKNYLVVDNYMLKEGDLIKMLLSQDSVYLILKDKKNVGLGYWQFECQRVAASSEKTVEKAQSKKGYDFI